MRRWFLSVELIQILGHHMHMRQLVDFMRSKHTEFDRTDTRGRRDLVQQPSSAAGILRLLLSNLFGNRTSQSHTVCEWTQIVDETFHTAGMRRGASDGGSDLLRDCRKRSSSSSGSGSSSAASGRDHPTHGRGTTDHHGEPSSVDASARVQIKRSASGGLFREYSAERWSQRCTVHAASCCAESRALFCCTAALHRAERSAALWQMRRGGVRAAVRDSAARCACG